MDIEINHTDVLQKALNNTLIQAIEKNDLAKLKTAIKEGASIEEPDSQGFPPLILAIIFEHNEALDMLIQAGADVHAEDKVGASSSSAFIYAIISLNLTNVEKLIKAGVDVNKVNSIGESALLCAVDKGSYAIVDLLVKFGANISHTNQQGKTALMLAAENKHRDIAFRLLSTMSLEEIKALEQSEHYDDLADIIETFHEEMNMIRKNMLAAFGLTSKEMGISAYLYQFYCYAWNYLPPVLNKVNEMKSRVADDLQNMTKYFTNSKDNAITEFAHKLYDVYSLGSNKVWEYIATNQSKETKLPKLPLEVVALIISNKNLYPNWYEHRITSDIRAILRKIELAKIKKYSDLEIYPEPVLFSSFKPIDACNEVEELVNEFENLRLK